MMENVQVGSPQVANGVVPVPPPLPGPTTSYNQLKDGSPLRGYSCVSTATKDLWENLSDSGFINTDYDGIIYGHANILGIASPTMRGILKQSKCHGRWRSLSIHGVPPNAVKIFIRFLYSSCFEKVDMEDYVLHQLVLSHVFVVRRLKRECKCSLEEGLHTMPYPNR
ncbi:BTB/POZ and TAZ domain-containing protein 4-like [Pistacia vera]|uniref:BTB/POZ and TAZ domain-containing protein 4-like n=1 Tax=Pistacia vera TaxID=55513 RepID=UPI001262CFD1|nr:BTB/POZ and TAZ domain-containing protein 4-like [Pistacia vera]XP_031274843.1 BTB/POZ and TAZ domain-containing protein 4-like [Pistacia vera]